MLLFENAYGAIRSQTKDLIRGSQADDAAANHQYLFRCGQSFSDLWCETVHEQKGKATIGSYPQTLVSDRELTAGQLVSHIAETLWTQAFSDPSAGSLFSPLSASRYSALFPWVAPSAIWKVS